MDKEENNIIIQVPLEEIKLAFADDFIYEKRMG